MVRVTLHEDAVKPVNWEEMSASQKDEWLWSMTKETKNIMEDIHHSEAIEIWENQSVEG